MASEAIPQPRWSELPIELLEIICRKIADIADFARFRSVCRSWRYATKPLNLSPQLPGLLLPYDPTSAQRSFFSFSTKSTYTLDLPETLNQNIYGSSSGWFVMFDKTLNVSLFNPLTRFHIQLPPITTFPEDPVHIFERVGDGFVHRDPETGIEDDITLERTEDYFDFYALISPSTNLPSTIDNGIVVFMVESSPKFQYWRPGDEAWMMMDCGLVSLVQAVAFHEGKLYVIDWNESTAICDLGPTGKAVLIPSLKIPTDSYFYNCLVTPSEGLLLVTRQNDTDDDEMTFNSNGIGFEYYKLDENEEMMTWTPIEGVGDCTIFLTEGQILGSVKLMSLACRTPGHRKNCSCSVIPWKGEDREGRQLSRLDAIITGDEYRDLCGSWTTSQPNLMSSSWIVPSL